MYIPAMRAYDFSATDDTIEALRQLRGPWAGYQVEPSALRVLLQDGNAIRVDVDGADIEASFEVFRVAAGIDRAATSVAAHDSPFGHGRNDVVVFAGESWIEPGVARPDAAPDEATEVVMQFSGRPGVHPEHAVALCRTSDAVLVATTSGTGVLVEIAARPYHLSVTEDRETIARFLTLRGYS